MQRTEWAKRVVVGVVAVVAVVGLAAAGATLEPQSSPEPTEHPEYNPDETLSEPLNAAGDLDVDESLGGGDGKVLIDQSHSNRFDLNDIAPMVKALTQAGYEVEVLV